MDVDGVDMLDDRLSGYELLDRLLAAANPGGRNQPVGDGRHFIPDVIGGGRVFDLHAVSQRQQAPTRSSDPKSTLTRHCPAHSSMVWFGIVSGKRSTGMMKTLKPGTRYTASRTAMAASQVWVRGQGTCSISLTVWRSGLSCPRITGRP